MKIEVTARDIQTGIPSDPCACPIAIAMERATGGEWTVKTVGAEREMSDHAEYYSLPKEAKSFIRCFDSELPVQPFSFELPERPEMVELDDETE